MSLWPVVGIQCYLCDANVSVFHFDLNTCFTDKEQAGFARRLTVLGWDTEGLPETEVDDDGYWTRACPKCRKVNEK